MRRLWNERKLLLVLNFVVILPDKFNDTLAKFLKVEAEGTNLNGIGFAPHPALAVVASPDHPLALFGGASWHHREKFPLAFIFCISITTSMAPNTLRGVPKPSPVEAQSRFPAQQNHLKNALRFHQHNSMYLFFFTAKFRLFPQIYFFSAFADSWRLSTICYPCARRSARLQCEPKDARQWGPETPHRVGLFPHLHEILSCKNMQNSQVWGEELPLPKLKVNARPM